MGDSSIVTRLLAGSALALVYATNAFAADTNTQSGGIETVVVTAEKRVERLQDAPVAITVVNSQQLFRDNVLTADQLQYSVPEITFNGQYAIRGISTQSFSAASENDVAVIIDGVVQGQGDVPVNSLFDVQRVEVLDGPQGMLYGRNSAAGAINIVTNAPDLSQQEFLAHVDIGERGYQVYQGVANLPLSDNLGLRLSGFSDDETGAFTNVFSGGHLGSTSHSGGRLRLLWEPTSNLTVNVTADYEKKFGNEAVFTVRQATPPMSTILAGCGITPGDNNYKACLDGPDFAVRENYGVSVQADYTFDGLTLTSITSDRQYTSVGQGDTDMLPINLLNINTGRSYDNQFSQEFRIASPTGDRLEYVAGLYFYDYTAHVSSDQAGTLFLLPFIADRFNTTSVNTFSYAAFGQATYHVTDAFSLIAGGRFTDDLIRQTENFGYNPAEGLPFPGFTFSGTYPNRMSTENFSYRVGGQYKFSPDAMFYITYAKGYKSGTFSLAVPPVAVKPEIPTDLEIGAKTSFFDNHLALDVAAFDETYKNFQAQVFDVVGGIGQFDLANASQLHSRGVQANIVATPFDGLTVNGGIIYNRATYGNFVVACDAAYTVGCTLVNGNLVTNAKGQQLFGAPLWKLNFGGQYDFAITDSLKGYVAGDLTYRAKTASTATVDPNTEIPGYATVNARIGVRLDDHYGISLFARNLFDKREPEIITVDPVEAGANYDSIFSSASFRVIGVSLDASL